MATLTDPAVQSHTKKITADVQRANHKCESLGAGKHLILHWNPSAIAKDLSLHMTVRRCHFLPNLSFPSCMLLHGTLGGIFDIFSASEESTAWVLLWKTRSRPMGVTVCPVALFNFFSTAFDPREWTMVVFWEENSGHQPQLMKPENKGRDETNYPSPPSDFQFFDDPDVPFGPQGPPPPEPPAPPRPPAPPGPPEQSGPQEPTTRMASSSIACL